MAILILTSILVVMQIPRRMSLLQIRLLNAGRKLLLGTVEQDRRLVSSGVGNTSSLDEPLLTRRRGPCFLGPADGTERGSALGGFRRASFDRLRAFDLSGLSLYGCSLNGSGLGDFGSGFGNLGALGTRVACIIHPGAFK